MGFTEERGKKFDFPTAPMARSTRQSIYEVRRAFAHKRLDPFYKPLFECHMKLDERTLYIGPHPLSFADEIMVSNADGTDKKPFVELACELESRALEYAKLPTSSGIEVDLSLMEKFMFGALLAQATYEIIREKNLDTLANNSRIKPLARKRALEYLLEGTAPNKENPFVAGFFEMYAAEFIEAKLEMDMEKEKSRLLYGMIGPTVEEREPEPYQKVMKSDRIKDINSEARREIDDLLSQGPLQLD